MKLKKKTEKNPVAFSPLNGDEKSLLQRRGVVYVIRGGEQFIIEQESHGIFITLFYENEVVTGFCFHGEDPVKIMENLFTREREISRETKKQQARERETRKREREREREQARRVKEQAKNGDADFFEAKKAWDKVGI